MGISHEHQGRANQKRRTRLALLDAALAIVREGRMPTVAEAAEAAAVSRATAYRYFSTQDALLAEVGLMRQPPSAADLMGAAGDSDDVVERVEALVANLTAFMVRNDRAARGLLKTALERSLATRGDVAVRQGRRAGYLAEALAPLREGTDPAALARLNAALGMVVGTEALVVLKDVYEMDDAAARAVMRWAAATLLRAALAGEGPPPA